MLPGPKMQVESNKEMYRFQFRFNYSQQKSVQQPCTGEIKQGWDAKGFPEDGETITIKVNIDAEKQSYCYRRL